MDYKHLFPDSLIDTDEFCNTILTQQSNLTEPLWMNQQLRKIRNEHPDFARLVERVYSGKKIEISARKVDIKCRIVLAIIALNKTLKPTYDSKSPSKATIKRCYKNFEAVLDTETNINDFTNGYLNKIIRTSTILSLYRPIKYLLQRNAHILFSQECHIRPELLLHHLVLHDVDDVKADYAGMYIKKYYEHFTNLDNYRKLDLSDGWWSSPAEDNTHHRRNLCISMNNISSEHCRNCLLFKLI